MKIKSLKQKLHLVPDLCGWFDFITAVISRSFGWFFFIHLGTLDGVQYPFRRSTSKLGRNWKELHWDFGSVGGRFLLTSPPFQDPFGVFHPVNRKGNN